MVDTASQTVTPAARPRGGLSLVGVLAGLVVLLACAVALGLRLGAVDVKTMDWIHLITPSVAPSPAETILREVRLPRVLLAVLAGMGLAAAGSTWQGLLRNPLADPYLIGVSAGGALGAGVAIVGEQWGLGSAWIPFAAFLGALGAVALVYVLAAGDYAIERVLLVGIAVGSFLTALMSFVSFWHVDAIATLTIWLLGSFSGRGWDDVVRMLPYWLGGMVVLFMGMGSLNVLQLGPERARSLGVDVEKSERWLIAGASLLTAATVASCGMIGFIGLVVPHVARLLVGHDLRRVLPTACVLGATLLVIADLVARTCWAPAEVPVGVLTALLGAPFFLALVVRRRKG